MNIIHQKNDNLTTFLNHAIKDDNKLLLDNIVKALESYDKELYVTKPPQYRIIKIIEKSIVTSIGYIRFKRRYYYDELLHCYTYLLDSVLGIPKRSRISNELKQKILLSIPDLSYRKAIQYICHKSTIISPTTVMNIIRNSKIKQQNKIKINTPCNIHVQVDEKYINVRNFDHKKPIYTATIFTGIKKVTPKRNFLTNRLLLLDIDQKNLFKKIDYHLKHSYQCSFDTICFLSGDAAKYIRLGPDKISSCKSIYVPDKFHIQSSMLNIFDFKLSKEIIGNDSYRLSLIQELSLKISNEENKAKIIEMSKLKSILKYHYSGLLKWYDQHYLGCSQEAINSHYIANRFAKIPNATYNKCNSIISHHDEFYDLPESLDQFIVINHNYKKIIDEYNYPAHFRRILHSINYS